MVAGFVKVWMHYRKTVKAIVAIKLEQNRVGSAFALRVAMEASQNQVDRKKRVFGVRFFRCDMVTMVRFSVQPATAICRRRVSIGSPRVAK